RRHARLYLADQLAAVETFPGRSGIVLADGPVLRIEQLCVRSLEDPAGGARRIAGAGIDLHARRRHHAKDRQLVRIERGGHLDHAILIVGSVRGGQQKGSGSEHRGETGQTDEGRKYGHQSLLLRLHRRSAENDGATLQKYFSYRQSRYVCNAPGERRPRASAAASSVLARGRRS